MSGAERALSDANTTDFERELLASWQDEQPSPEARARTLAMLGVGTGAALTAAAGGSLAPKAIGTGAFALAKWLAVSAVAIGATIATVAYVRNTAPVSAVAPPVRPPSAPATDPPVPPVFEAPPIASPIAPVAEPAPVSAPTLKSPRAAAPVQDARSAGSALAEQIALLDRARSALAAGDALRARQLVDDYEAHFPNGSFLQEAEVLRIDALLAQNDRAEAKRVGARFLAAHPSSPHANRVRALLGASP